MDIEWWKIIALGCVGIASGWLNVMAGGGSLLTIPLMLFMGIPAPVANGTNRIGILFQNLAAVYGFFRKGYSDFKLSLSLAACGALGGVGGAMIGVKIEGVWFNYLIATVMVGIMLITALDIGSSKKTVALTSSDGNSNDNRRGIKNLYWGHVLMIGAGFWGGFIQVGVGFILMPILNRFMGLDLKRTNMHKVFIVLTYTTIALWIYASQAGLLWVVGLVLAVGTTIGGYLGAHTTVTKGEKWIKIVLYSTLSIFIVKLLFFN